jgi:hypothetical protein
MDRNERLDRIDELRRQADEGRARIAEREAERERDPIAMDNYLRGEREAAAAAEQGTLVQRRADEGLIHRTVDNALVTVPEGAVPSDDDDWNRWFSQGFANHFEPERIALLDRVAEGMAEFVSGYLREEMQPLKTEIAELKRALMEREERATAIAEVRKQYVGLERQRQEAELAARDTRIAALEQRVEMLLKFLSLTGLDLPKGLW